MSIDRRTLIVSSAATLAVGLAAGQPDIIDTHVHFYDPRRPQGVPWPPRTDASLYRPVLPPDYRKLADPLGIRGVIVVEASAWLEDNEWVLDLAKEHRIIKGVVGHLEPTSGTFARDLERFHRNPLFRGIRLGGRLIDDAAVDSLRLLSEADLSLDAIGNATMLPALARLSDRLPSLRIIINHMPSEPPGWKPADIRELAQRKTIYAKVSGVLRRIDGKVPDTPAAYKEQLDEMWGLFGADRVVFGSNWPVSDRIAPLSTVVQVVRDYVNARGAVDARKYFRDNARMFYRWS